MNRTVPKGNITEEQRWNEFISRIEKRKKRRHLAEALLFACGIIAAVLLLMPVERAIATRQLVAESSGFEKTVVLPDGSFVRLSPGSSIFYPEAFEDTREVRLLGEALFIVESSPQHPFLVHMNGGTVKVTGTRFTATSFPDADDFKVSLEKGRVELEVDGMDPIIMHPSQEIRIERSSGKTAEKHLVFKDSRLEDIMNSVSVIYDAPFTMSEGLKDIRLSLRLLQYDDVSKVMTLIGIACGINYAISADGTLILTEK